jgi:hypothetical protein
MARMAGDGGGPQAVLSVPISMMGSEAERVDHGGDQAAIGDDQYGVKIASCLLTDAPTEGGRRRRLEWPKPTGADRMAPR